MERHVPRTGTSPLRSSRVLSWLGAASASRVIVPRLLNCLRRRSPSSNPEHAERHARVRPPVAAVSKPEAIAQTSWIFGKLALLCQQYYAYACFPVVVRVGRHLVPTCLFESSPASSSLRTTEVRRYGGTVLCSYLRRGAQSLEVLLFRSSSAIYSYLSTSAPRTVLVLLQCVIVQYCSLAPGSTVRMYGGRTLLLVQVQYLAVS